MNKKLLSIIALILVLCFAFVSCGETETPPVTDPCASGHTFESADAWKFDETMHWHEATCDHTDLLGDVQGHIDENIDGACDVCGYDRDHEHSFKDTYSFDETKHWQESTCYHKVTNNEGAHTPNVMGICTVCSYVVSEPDIDSVKDAVEVGSNQAGLVENGMVDSGYGEYIAPVYAGTIVITEQIAQWGVAGEYTFNIYPDNTVAVYLDGEEAYAVSIWYYNYDASYDISLNNLANTIWWDFIDYELAFYNADGETTITELDGEVTVENEDGEVWATLVFDGEEVTASAEDHELVTESMNSAMYEFRDGYFYVMDNYGEYYYSVDANGDVFCAYYSFWDGTSTRNELASLDNLKGYQFPTNIVGGVDGVAFYGVEDLVKTLYSMASVDNINDDFEEEITDDYYKFSFGYYVADYEALYVIEVYFTLAEETYVFENVAVLSNVYTGETVELLTEATGDTPATYGVAEGAVASYAYYIIAMQNIDDTEVENPYNPDTLLMKDYNFITTDGDIITDTITVNKGETLTLIFENIAPTTADHNFNSITFEGENVGAFDGLAPWYNVGEDFIKIDAYCAAGTYELTIIVNGYEKTFTVNVVEVPATEITAGIIAPHYNEFNGSATGNKIVEEITEISVEAGSNKILAAYLDSVSDSVTITITPDVTIYDEDLVNEGIIVGEDYKNVRSYGLNVRNIPIGEYTVTFTANSDESLSTSIALTVTERQDVNGLEGAGTNVDPFIITELGNFVGQVDDESSVFFAYTAEEDMTVILTSDNENRFISYGLNVNLLADSLSKLTTNTAAITLAEGDTLYIEVATFDWSADEIEFSLALPSAEAVDITGTYTGSNPYQNTLTIVIDEETVTFTQGDYTVTFPYSMVGEVVTLYKPDGVTPWESYFYALTVSGGALSSVVYNGNSYTVFAGGSGDVGGEDDGDVLEEGTFVLTDNQGLNLAGTYNYTLYNDNTVELTLDGESVTAFSIEYDGTYWVINSIYANIAMTLGTPAILCSAPQTPVTALEGTANIYQVGPGGFALVSLEFGATGGEVGGDDTNTGSGTEDDPYVIESLPTEVTINSDTLNQVYYVFTATEFGYVNVIYPDGDSWINYTLFNNGVADGSVSGQTSQSEGISFAVEAGNTYRLGLSTWWNAGEYTVNITLTDEPVFVEYEPIYEDVTVGPIDVIVHNNGYDQVPTYITFVATEDGTYTLSAAADEEYAQAFDAEGNWLNLPYVFVLRADESVTFAIHLGNYDLSEDTVNLVLEKTAEYPSPVEEFELQNNGEKVESEISIEAGMYYYFDINVITTNASMQFATLSIAGENINAPFNFDDLTAYNNCLMVEYSKYTNQISLKTLKAPAGTTFTFTITIDNAVNTYSVTVAPTVPTSIVAGSVEDFGWGFSYITEVTEVTITAGDAAFIAAFVNRNLADDLVVYLDDVIVNAAALTSYEFYDNNLGAWCPGAVIDLSTLEAGTYAFSFASNANAELTASITVTVNEAEGGTEDDNTAGAITGNGSEEIPYVVAGEGSVIIAAQYYTPVFITVNAGYTVTIDGDAEFWGDVTDSSSIIGTSVTATETTTYYIYATTRAGAMCQLVSTLADSDDDTTEAITGDGSEETPYVVAGEGSVIIAAQYYTPVFITVNAGYTVTIDGDAEFWGDVTDSSSIIGTSVTATETTTYYIYATTRAGATCQVVATAN